MKLFPIILFCIVLITGCGIAENEIIQNLPSPDGKYYAVSFIRSAGATTADSPQVSIIKRNMGHYNKKGNVFIGYRSREIDVWWKNDNTLAIWYDCPDDDVFKKLSKIYEIQIEYPISKFDH